jgi:glucosyl-3-phosphoglycerate synthase
VTDPRERWLRERTSRSGPDDLAEALRLKGARTVSLVVPARDEAATVGPLVRTLHDGLCVQTHLVDELVVVDDDSRDATGRLAAAAGARVVTRAGTHPEVPSAGKGCAMWRGLAATTGDLVVFLDADVPDFAVHWVAGLLLPLLRDDRVALVKATYDRPLEVDGVAHPGSGGRVTRLVATPVLNVLAPELVVFGQPLAGETAARRDLLERLPFMTGYGVELRLLLDAHAEVGLDGLAQVDLGVRTHRHQSDAALGAMAVALLHLSARWYGRADVTAPTDATYARVVRDGSGVLGLQVDPVPLALLPPLADRQDRAAVGERSARRAVRHR